MLSFFFLRVLILSGTLKSKRTSRWNVQPHTQYFLLNDSLENTSGSEKNRNSWIYVMRSRDPREVRSLNSAFKPFSTGTINPPLQNCVSPGIACCLKIRSPQAIYSLSYEPICEVTLT